MVCWLYYLKNMNNNLHNCSICMQCLNNNNKMCWYARNALHNLEMMQLFL